MQLDHIFDINLQATKMEHLNPFGGKEGYLSATGEGTVEGPRLKGTVQRFSFFERNREDGLCATEMRGIIETEDGATIMFDTNGYAYPDQAGPGVWGDLTSVKFIAQDENYQWLNTVFGVWEGTIDVNNGTLHYTVYAASNQLVGDPEGQ